MKVNSFKSVKDTAPSITRNVTYFLDRIKNGKSATLINRLRDSESDETKKAIKLMLHAVTFNGAFHSRSKDQVKESSGLLTLDFDNFKTIEEAYYFKSDLKKDNHIFAAWISPSQGVKALYRIMQVKDDAEFKKVFSQVAKIY